MRSISFDSKKKNTANIAKNIPKIALFLTMELIFYRMNFWEAFIGWHRKFSTMNLLQRKVMSIHLAISTIDFVNWGCFFFLISINYLVGISSTSRAL